jgi:2-keto-4-pentenoate hydratase
MRAHGRPLRPGQVILTGARILATPVSRPAQLRAQVQGLGSVELAV